MSSKEFGFPTIGEIISFLLESIGIKVEGSIKKDIQRLEEEKDYGLERFPEILDFIEEELSRILGSKKLINKLISLLNTLLVKYKKIILKNVGTNKKITIKFMLISMIPEIITEVKSLNFNFKSPDSKLWFLPKIENNKISKYPFNNILKYYYQLKGLKSRDELAKIFSEKIYGDKTHINEYKQKFYRWSNNKTDMNLSYFFEELERFEDDKELLFNIKLLFMVTKSIQFSIKKLKEELGEDFFFEYINYIANFYLNKNDNSFDRLYKRLNEKIENRRTIFIKTQKLKENQLSLNSKKNKKSKIEAIKLIEELKNDKYGHEFISYINWFKARLNILSGNLKEAHEFYKLAFENGKYVMGADLKEIIKEGIILAVWLEDKRLIKKIYNFGIYFELFKEPYNKIKSWFIREKKVQFDKIFNLDSFFPDANIDTIKDEVSNIRRRYMKDPKEQYVELDLEKPNKKIKIADEYLTQLYQASYNREVDKVKKLLNKGANPNWKREDNSHSLMLAVQTNNFGSMYKKIKKQSTEIANLILDSPRLEAETINSITNRKKISAMHEVISWGNINLLEKMLKKGGDVNLKATLDDLPLLYHTLQLLLHQKQGFIEIDKLSDTQDDDIESIMAGNELFTDALLNNELKELFKARKIPEIKNIINEQHKINIKNIPILSIIELLLKYNANVDLKVKKKYTPLLFSAEVGDLKIFKKLLTKSKNILDENEDKDTILSISLGWHKYAISKFLLTIPKIIKIIDKLSLNHKIGYITPLARVVYIYLIEIKYNNYKDFESYEIIELLIIKGANPYIKGDISAIELAFEYRNRELIELFGNFK